MLPSVRNPSKLILKRKTAFPTRDDAYVYSIYTDKSAVKDVSVSKSERTPERTAEHTEVQRPAVKIVPFLSVNEDYDYESDHPFEPSQ